MLYPGGQQKIIFLQETAMIERLGGIQPPPPNGCVWKMFHWGYKLDKENMKRWGTATLWTSPETNFIPKEG